MTETPATWLTQEAYDRLQAEYDHLVNVGRAEIAKEIDERRQEGDLKENGGYHAARDEQAKMEARIQERHPDVLAVFVKPERTTDPVILPGRFPRQARRIASAEAPAPTR